MTPDKEKIYENVTQKLVKTIEKMGMEKLQRMRAKNLVLLFRDSFKLPEIKHKTFWADLGEEMYRFDYDADGFCRASSVDFALMMGGAPDWKLMYIDDLWTYGPHHYLFHIPSKTILDLTYDQYTHAGMGIPYYLGKPIELEFKEQDIEGRFAKALNLTSLLNNNQKD